MDFLKGCIELFLFVKYERNYRSCTYLTGAAAEYFVSKKGRSVRINFLSLEKFVANESIDYKTLFGSGINIATS